VFRRLSVTGAMPFSSWGHPPADSANGDSPSFHEVSLAPSLWRDDRASKPVGSATLRAVERRQLRCHLFGAIIRTGPDDSA